MHTYFLLIFFGFTSIFAKSADAADDLLFKICGVVNRSICSEIIDKPESDPNLLASYALGVKFQREIESNFSDLDYSLFLRGVYSARNNLVAISNGQIEDSLKNLIMTEVDRSNKFLKEYIDREDVIKMDGVFVRKSITNNEANFFTKKNPQCYPDSTGTVGEGSNDKVVYEFAVEFIRLKLDNRSFETLDEASHLRQDEVDCLRVNSSEVIRGWRTVLNNMEEADVWDVVIPANLAYGSKGLSDFVEADVALRFLMKKSEN